MDEDFWDIIKPTYGEEDPFMPAYDQNDYDIAHSDEEQQEWDYDDEEEGGEFKVFDEYDPDEYGVSYQQLEQISYGDPELGMSLGGKFAKFEKIVQVQTVSKEKLYLNKLKAELNQYFPFDKSNHYAILIQKVPRFWLKNSETIVATIYMIDELKKSPLIGSKLARYSTRTNVRKEDLFRYYRLLKEYIT